MSGKFRRVLTDGAGSWPPTGPFLSDLAHRIRYTRPAMDRDLLLAASYLSSYAALVALPQKRRAKVCSALSANAKLAWKARLGDPDTGFQAQHKGWADNHEMLKVLQELWDSARALVERAKEAV